MKFLRFALPLLSVGVLPFLELSPRLAAKDVDGAELYDKVVKSCVYIITPAKGGMAQGSGSLIDAEQKLVLTNYHVVEEQDLVFVQFPVYIKGELLTDKEKYKQRIPQGLAVKGTVLCRDRARDLALLKLESIPPEARAIPLAKSSPRINAPVWQIGNAGAIKQVFRVSRGEVSAVGVIKDTIGGGDRSIELNAKMVTTTNPINQGDSGGPLYDKRGYQVGVTESIDNRGKLVSLFVDVTEVRALLTEKKIKIKDLADEPEAKAEPKKGPIAIDTPPKKDSAVKVPPATTDPPPVIPEPKKDDVPAASAADERAASDKLRSAKLFALGEDNRPTYIAKLTEIVKKYPTTMAGKDAKKLLDGLK